MVKSLWALSLILSKTNMLSLTVPKISLTFSQRRLRDPKVLLDFSKIKLLSSGDECVSFGFAKSS